MPGTARGREGERRKERQTDREKAEGRERERGSGIVCLLFFVIMTSANVQLPENFELHLAVTCEEVDEQVKAIMKEAAVLGTIGFDMEWKPNFIKGRRENKTALVQLSTFCRCSLLQICATGMCDSLRKLLEDDSIKKCGAGISGDSAKLKRDFDISMSGLVELRNEAKARNVSTTGGLKNLVKTLLKKEMEKPKSLRLGNWERVPLNENQQHYAALDAYISLLLHEKLRSIPLSKNNEEFNSAIESGKRENNDIQAEESAPKKRKLEVATSSGKENMVPKNLQTKPLSAAKQSCYDLHFHEKYSLSTIATMRNIKMSTVVSYLSEAIQNGHAYHWDIFEVSPESMKKIAHIANRLGLLKCKVMPSGSIGKIINELEDESINVYVRLVIEHLRRDYKNELAMA